MPLVTAVQNIVATELSALLGVVLLKLIWNLHNMCSGMPPALHRRYSICYCEVIQQEQPSAICTVAFPLTDFAVKFVTMITASGSMDLS